MAARKPITLGRAIRWLMAAAIFTALAYVPWHYWESARLVMRQEAPIGTMGIMSKSEAQDTWWVMGITLIFWAPVWLALSSLAAWAFLRVTKPKDPVTIVDLAQLKAERERKI